MTRSKSLARTLLLVTPLALAGGSIAHGLGDQLPGEYTAGDSRVDTPLPSPSDDDAAGDGSGPAAPGEPSDDAGRECDLLLDDFRSIDDQLDALFAAQDTATGRRATQLAGEIDELVHQLDTITALIDMLGCDILG